MVVQVRVLGLALDEAGQHVLLVKPLGEPPGTGRMLPIWIGSLEATSIMVALQGTPVPRPLAHDLMRSLLEGAGPRSSASRSRASTRAPTTPRSPS